MSQVAPLPAEGEVFFDPRDEGRSLRVSRHPELGVVVVSLSGGRECLGSFRLAAGEASRLARALPEADEEGT